jgi:cyanophycinase
MTDAAPPGPLVLVGGGEWLDGNEFDRELLVRAGREVLILPTAAAYERPERAVATAESWFAALGGKATGLMVLNRADAQDDSNAKVVSTARFIYLSGGSPLHLRSVLKGSVVYEALVEAWRAGAVVAGSSAGAMVLTDPMVDPRGGALTVGLGLVEQVAVVPHYDPSRLGSIGRTLALAPRGVPVACISERTALIREPAGHWRRAGAGSAAVFVDGEVRDLRVLP